MEKAEFKRWPNEESVRAERDQGRRERNGRWVTPLEEEKEETDGTDKGRKNGKAE